MGKEIKLPLTKAETVEERLKELRKHNPSGLIIHVGGVMHMVEAKYLDVPTLIPCYCLKLMKIG